jgi:D-3-phosphoglycerate dehydrogenase / 2-oxoglutarate reductase
VKLLIASPIDPDAYATLSSRHQVDPAFNAPPDELARRIADADVLIFRSGVEITAAVIGAARRLRLIIRAGSGLDNIDLAAVRERGLRLERVPGPGARAVAELTFGLLLAVGRRILEADHAWRAGHWKKAELGGSLLANKTLGVIGVGNIGRQVARMGVAWQMRVIGCVKHPSEGRESDLEGERIGLLELRDVLATADFVTIHVPLNDETRGLIGEAEFALMKPGSILINIARGGIVDEAALLRALSDGHLRGAGLDVHENEGEGRISPLAHLENVVLTPHIGAATIDSQAEIGREVVNLIAELEKHAESS